MTYPIYVSYWPVGSKHNHQVLLSDGSVPLADIFSDVEGCAEELAEAVLRCNEGRHKGHGQTHPGNEAQKAFKAAVEQLLTTDFAVEWQEIQDGIRKHKLWGGPVPSAVLGFSPDDPKTERLIMPDKNGNPVVYDIKNPVGLLPPPEEGKTAWRDKQGVGWITKRKRSHRPFGRRAL